MTTEILIQLGILIPITAAAIVSIIVALQGKAAAQLGTKQNVLLGQQNELIARHQAGEPVKPADLPSLMNAPSNEAPPTKPG